MGFWDFLFGKSAEQVPAITPEQQKAQNTLLQNLPQLLQVIGTGVQPSSPAFENIANREMNRFQTQTVPSLAERFTAMGSPLSSGGYREALRRGSVDLHTNLAALGSQYGLNERGQNLELLRSLLTGGMSPATHYIPAQGGLLHQLINAGATVGSAYLGGPMAALGAVGALGGGGNKSYDFGGGYQTINDVNSMLGSYRKPMSTQDFFSSSGIMRG